MKRLFIVATPIGNLQDITLRAAKTLLSVPVIVAESASKASNLISFLEKEFPQFIISRPKIISFSENEEEAKIQQVLKLEEDDAALISEAGTPLISDPGFKLVREAVVKGIEVIPVPGASAVITALSASGLPTDKFLFIGFLPKSHAKKEKQLQNVKKIIETDKKFIPTVILYESPYRIIETLSLIQNIFGDIDAVSAREITKIYEEFVRGKISEILNNFKRKPPKGEITLLFSLKAKNS